MDTNVHNLVLIYVLYIISMTVLISELFYFSLKNIKHSFEFLEVAYFMTSAYFILMSGSIELALFICVYLWLVPRFLYVFGRTNLASILSVLFHEIIMSLTYYSIVKGGLINALYSLYFYGTDIPSFSLPIYQVVPIGIIETINSFMFFLMILPEIVFVCIKFRRYDILLVSLLSLSGPNIASEMTHSILPISHDPIKESSLLALFFSLFLQFYFGYSYIKGRINEKLYITFILSNFILSISSLYYALSVNEIPYALSTLAGITVSLLFVNKNNNNNNRKFYSFLPIISPISELAWGSSVAIFYNYYNAIYALAISSFVISLLPMLYLKTVYFRKM